MQQQNQIVINFSEIFSPVESEPVQVPQPSGSQQIQLNQSVQTAPVLVHSYSEPQKLTSKHLRPLSHHRTTASLTNETHLMPLSLVIEQDTKSSHSYFLGRPNINRTPKASQEEVQKMVQRLTKVQHKKFKGTLCQKSRLDERKPGEIKHEIIKTDKEQQKPSRSIKKNTMSKTYKQLSRSSVQSNDLTIFQRLHYEGRLNQLKAKYQLNLSHTSTSSLPQNPSCSLDHRRSKSKYLKSYVPFYSRLQSEINHSFQKLQRIEQCSPYAVSDQRRPPFQPQLYNNKYNRKARPKYMEGYYKTILPMESGIEHPSLNTSGASLLTINRSAEIMQEVQSHFYKKMHCIFVQEDVQVVEITEKAISLLTETQFQLLHQFIFYVTEHPVPKEQFNYYLHSYYNSLSLGDKIKLRNHETKDKHKYVMMQQEQRQILKKNKPKSQKEQQKEALTLKTQLRVSRSRYTGQKHHLYIHQFI